MLGYNFLNEGRREMMKYGVEVVITQTAYVEVEATCEAEAKHIAEQMALDGDVEFHESEVAESKVSCYVYE